MRPISVIGGSLFLTLPAAASRCSTRTARSPSSTMARSTITQISKPSSSARGTFSNSDHSDTEILVHGYEEWGSCLPERLNGMFAFAIYDKPKRRLFLARDRFGEKPLYYSDRDGFFAFASELHAFKQHSLVQCFARLSGAAKAVRVWLRASAECLLSRLPQTSRRP